MEWLSLYLVGSVAIVASARVRQLGLFRCLLNRDARVPERRCVLSSACRARCMNYSYGRSCSAIGKEEDECKALSNMER